MELFKPFGPQIGYTQLTDDDNDLLLNICLNNKDDLSRRCNKNLAGFIDCEFTILDLARPKFLNVVTKLVSNYVNSAESVYNIKANINDLTCASGWCNIQKEKEFNPLHDHPLHDIVCVIFPKVEMSTEKVHNVSPGTLTFNFGSRCSNFGSSSYTVYPKSKDVYIFPGDLLHCTTPVWDKDDVRISTSFNFIFNDLFKAKIKL